MPQLKSTARPKAADRGAERQQLQPIAIEDLKFDHRNPRLADLLTEHATQAQIRDVLINRMEGRELVPSFMQNGYLPYEPLIVRPERNGSFVVLEGNRRLAALLAMRDSDDPEERQAYERKNLGKPPCLVFEGDEEQELAYLGLRHLAKTKDWSASAKAAFVERILESGATLAEAARLTNTTRNALRLMLLVRRLFERAGTLGVDLPMSDAEGEVTFWHLGDAVRRSNTRKYLRMQENENPLKQPALDERRFELLVGWLYGNPKDRRPRIITTIRDIPDLDRCLGTTASANALEAGASLADALEKLEPAVAKIAAHLDRAKTSVQKATGALSDVKSTEVRDIREARSALGDAVEAFDSGVNARTKQKSRETK